MLKIKKVAVALTAAMLFSSGAVVAQDQGGYVGVKYAALAYDNPVREWDIPAMFFSAGYQINPHFAVEGRFGLGVGSETITIPVTSGSTTVDVGAEIELDNYYGIFARVGAPASDVFYPYFMAGYGEQELDLTVSVANDSVSVSDSESDFAYGIGANVNVIENLSLNVEYMNYYDEDDGDITGFSLGLNYRF